MNPKLVDPCIICNKRESAHLRYMCEVCYDNWGKKNIIDVFDDVLDAVFLMANFAKSDLFNYPEFIAKATKVCNEAEQFRQLLRK